jgi:putative ABC transport system ATP-binding protein
VAIARAFARRTAVVIADEPTAHLDHDLAGETTSLLADLAGEGACVVLATHDESVAERADARIRLEDGRTV